MFIFNSSKKFDNFLSNSFIQRIMMIFIQKHIKDHSSLTKFDHFIDDID